MEERITDPRFAYIEKDPRFRPIPKHEKKIKIDKRFKGMFKDEKFKVKYTVDKRGRPANYTSAENLKKFYELSSDEESDQGDFCSESRTSDSASPTKPKYLLLKNKQKCQPGKVDVESKSESVSEGEDEESKSEIVSEGEDEESIEVRKEKLSKGFSDVSVDYSRGQVLMDSSSSDDESSDEGDMEERIEHPWGELDKDAERGEEETCRLALCNMDWDRIKAEDLFLLFSSFLPKCGIIKNVTIYPSDFGLEKMEEDNLAGPAELRSDKSTTLQDEGNEQLGEEEFNREKLRSYQLKRLRYFYAVIECDSIETASTIYKECDGMEYESSAARIDLRFIPEDTTFDDREPRDSCCRAPDPSKYRPRFFINTALQQINVKLTWDETNPDMLEATRQAFLKKGKVDDERLMTYIASEESEEEEEKVVKEVEENVDEDPIMKYRKLLSGLDDGDKDNDVEMEISWEPELEKKAVEIVENRKKAEKDDTPWEQYLEKRKEKRKAKKKEKKKAQDDGEDDEAEENSGELELLLMDEKDDKHYDLKELVSKDNRQVEEKEENFKVNVDDPRFGRLYSSHLFNIDPSDPQYKKTKGMELFVEKKLKRYREDKVEHVVPAKKVDEVKQAELSTLVRSIKSKANRFKYKAKR